VGYYICIFIYSQLVIPCQSIVEVKLITRSVPRFEPNKTMCSGWVGWFATNYVPFSDHRMKGGAGTGLRLERLNDSYRFMTGYVTTMFRGFDTKNRQILERTDTMITLDKTSCKAFSNVCKK